MIGVHTISVSSNQVGRSQGHVPGGFTLSISLHKMTMVYTHVLNLDWRVFAVLWAGFEQWKEVIMPIRISWRDKSMNRVQLFEYKEVSTLLASDPMACYTDRKTKLRILCGSV